jgi:nitrogen-specific signal transduction histidine kinase
VVANPEVIYGIGLGLTLARQVAEEHGGSVCFEESNRERTVFTLSLAKNRYLSLEDLQSGRAGFEICGNGSANCS